MSTLYATLVPLLSALAMVLLHSLWICTLAALLFVLLRHCLRWRSPQVGYWTGLALFGGMLLALGWCAWIELGAVEARDSGAVASVQVMYASAAEPATDLSEDRSSLLLSGLGAAWLLGMLVSAARTWRAWRSLRRVVALAQPLPLLQARLQQLGQRIGSSSAVRVVGSALEHAPFVIGLLKPVIVLPASALSGLTPVQIEAILLHELAHVRRADLWVNLLQVLAETVLFFHPAVRWLSDEIRRLREECCDDLVLAGGVSRSHYARALLGLEQRRQLAADLAPGALAGALLARIDRIVDERKRTADRAPRSAPLLALALFFVVIALGLGQSGLQPAQQVDGLLRRVLDVSSETLPRLAPAPIALDSRPLVALPRTALEAPPADAAAALEAAPGIPADDLPAAPRALRVSPERPLLAAPPTVQLDAVVAPELGDLPVVADRAPAPVPRLRVPPVYPQPALDRNPVGAVLLSYSLDARGRPVELEVERSSGNTLFVGAATAALRKWRYPATGHADHGRRLLLEFRFEPTGCMPLTGTRICPR